MQGMTLLSGVLSTLVSWKACSPPSPLFSPPPPPSFPPSQASLFKHAKRADMVQFAPTVLRHLSSCGLADSDNTLLRKLNVKLAQVTLTV